MNAGAGAVKEPMHGRVAGWLERTFNPIMVKELRASLRGTRFFVAHMTILSLFAAGLLLALGVTMASSSEYFSGSSSPFIPDPSSVGRQVYLITQLLHLGVVFLVVPGLAATTISSERESLTHDLLLTTTMTARHIVWGKFTAAMTQAFTIFVSMVPLVGLCFLFGGITVYQILANYAFLFGLSALMIAYALSMSASARSTQRAVGTVYGLALLGGGVLWGFAAALWGTPLFEEMAVAYGFFSPGEELRFGGRSLETFRRVMYVHVIPGFAWAALLALFFINATNRLKPLFANRSTPLRIYFAAVLFGAGTIVALTFYRELPLTEPAMDRSYAMMSYVVGTLTISLLGALFACEEPALPARRGAEPRGLRRLLAIFRPGSETGAAYSLVLSALFLGLSFLAFVPYAQGFDRGPWAGLPSAYPLGLALLSAFLWSFLCSMFARFLAAVMPGRPVLLRTILVLTCLFLALFPLIHWMIAEAIDRDELDVHRRTGPLTLGLSPVMAILSALDLSPARRDFPLYAGPLPIPAAFALVSIGLGVALLLWGNRIRAKLRAEAARA